MTGKIYKFFFSVILLLCFLGYLATFGLPSCLDCQETPEFVYRVNSREPSIIFQQGMQSLGDNKNLFQHVTGASCSLGPLKNSAFVATTLSISFARLFSIQMLWQPSKPPEFVYVYTIRATEFFYDVGASLIKGYKETGNGDYEEVADLFSNEEEWVAYQGIPREQFKSVAVYSRGSTYASAKFVRTEKNPFYVHKRTRGNRDVFPLNGKVTTVSLVATSSPDPISACFAFCFSKKSARFDSSGACPMKQMVYQAELSAKGSYWDSTYNHHSEGLPPWKEVTSTEGSHKVERPEECEIDTGDLYDASSLLKINCPQNKFYERFRVYLKGGMGPGTLFYTKHMGGVAGRTWTMSARQVRMGSGGTLEDKGFTIYDVFGDIYEIWWSEIHIYPLYPIIRSRY